MDNKEPAVSAEAAAKLTEIGRMFDSMFGERISRLQDTDVRRMSVDKSIADDNLLAKNHPNYPAI